MKRTNVILHWPYVIVRLNIINCITYIVTLLIYIIVKKRKQMSKVLILSVILSQKGSIVCKGIQFSLSKEKPFSLYIEKTKVGCRMYNSTKLSPHCYLQIQ